MFRPAIVPVLGAAVVGFCVPGLYAASWRLFVEESSCRPVQPDDCMGAPLAMAVVGLPVVYAAWAAGLWLTGARFAWLAPLAIGVALFGVARVLGPVGTPVVVWLVIAALLSSGWRSRFGPETGRRAPVSPGP
jgi:hypothetical protein